MSYQYFRGTDQLKEVDVVVLTKNSEHLLDRCLRSVYENVPVKRLIVVDGFSTDNTLKIVENFDREYGNVKVISEKGSRAAARERGIKEVETPWFMFVDSDIILCKDWYKKAEKYMDENVGAVWGLNIDVIPNIRNRLFYTAFANVSRACFNLRGGMHDTLIRSELVKDIKIPERLHAYEDAYIINYVKNKKKKVEIGDDMYCWHLRPQSDWNLRESISLALLEVKCGLIYSHVTKFALYYPFFIFYWVLQILSKRSGDQGGSNLTGELLNSISLLSMSTNSKTITP